MDKRKVAGIETARILAATVVLVQHGMLLTLSASDASHRYVSWLGPASGMAVNLFYLISGYLLVPALLAPHPNTRRFLTRRILRLTPLYYAVGVFMLAVWLVTYHHFPVNDALSHFTYTSIYTGSFLVGQAWTLCVEFAFAFMLVPIAYVVRSLTDSMKSRVILLVTIGVAGAIVADVIVNVLNGKGTLKVAPIAGLLPLLLGGALALLPTERFAIGRWRMALLALLLLWPISTHVGDAATSLLLESIASAAALTLLIPTEWKVSRLGRFSYGVYLWQLPLLDVAFYAMFGTFYDTHTPSWGLLPAALFTCGLFAVTLVVSIASYRWIELPFMRTRGSPSGAPASEARARA